MSNEKTEKALIYNDDQRIECIKYRERERDGVTKKAIDARMTCR